MGGAIVTPRSSSKIAFNAIKKQFSKINDKIQDISKDNYDKINKSNVSSGKAGTNPVSKTNSQNLRSKNSFELTEAESKSLKANLVTLNGNGVFSRTNSSSSLPSPTYANGTPNESKKSNGK